MITTWSLVCTFAAFNVPLKTVFSSDEWTVRKDANTVMFTSMTENMFYVFPRSQCAVLVQTRKESNANEVNDVTGINRGEE